MKRIFSEDQISAQASRGTGNPHSQIAQPSVYVPNYKGVNHILHYSGGSGKVSFMNALASTSQKQVAYQQSLYDNMEVNQALASVDSAYRQESEKFFQDNPSGRNYTEYITNKYDELSNTAVNSGSNQTVRDKLKLVFSHRKADVANNAFKMEQERYTGWAINETEQQLAATANELMLSPGEVQSLSTKYQQQLSSLQTVIAPDKFEKFARKKIEQFTYSYGLGLIKNNPYTAVEMVKGTEFSSKLSPEQFARLQAQARYEVEHQDYKARQYQAMIDSANKREELSLFHKMEIGIYQDSISKASIENANLSDEYKVRLFKTYDSHIRKSQNKVNVDNLIADALKKGTIPGDKLKAEDQSKFLQGYFKGENEKRNQAGQAEMSFVEMVKFLQDHQLVFKATYHPINNQIHNTIRKGTDAAKLLDASFAIAGNSNIPALGKIDKDVKDFACLAHSIFDGNSSSPDYIIKVRDDYFSADNATIEYNKQKWKEAFPSSEQAAKLKDFYDDNGYYHWFGASIEQSLDVRRVNTKMIDIMKRVFYRTGSEQKAYAVAASRLKSLVKYDPYSNRYAINPPTTENTGLTQDKLQNTIDEDLKASLAIAKNAGNSGDLKGITVKDLHLESVDFHTTDYNVYYLADPDDYTSRMYLYNKNGQKIIMNPAPKKEPKKDANS